MDLRRRELFNRAKGTEKLDQNPVVSVWKQMFHVFHNVPRKMGLVEHAKGAWL